MDDNGVQGGTPAGLAQQALGFGGGASGVGELTPGDDTTNPTADVLEHVERLNAMRTGLGPHPLTAAMAARLDAEYGTAPRLTAEHLTPGCDGQMQPLIMGSAIPAVGEPAGGVVHGERVVPAPAAKTTVQMSLEGALRVAITMIETGQMGQAVRLLTSIADQLPAYLRDPKMVGER